MSNSIYRVLLNSDTHYLEQIYMLGYDAWADAAPVDQYLENCRTSEKYQRGTWHVLLNGEEVVCALIVYSDGFSLPAGSVGIGSVATSLTCRNKGYASELLQHVIATQDASSISLIYLFADIKTSLYERMGFVAVGCDSNTGCMVRNNAGKFTRVRLSIDYF